MDLEAALGTALAEAGLGEDQRGTVRVLASQDDDRWRECCGSGCSPCVLQLARAVDRVRELMA